MGIWHLPIPFSLRTSLSLTGFGLTFLPPHRRGRGEESYYPSIIHSIQTSLSHLPLPLPHCLFIFALFFLPYSFPSCLKRKEKELEEERGNRGRTVERTRIRTFPISHIYISYTLISYLFPLIPLWSMGDDSQADGRVWRVASGVRAPGPRMPHYRLFSAAWAFLYADSSNTITKTTTRRTRRAV